MIPAEAVEAAARQLFFQHSNTNGPSLADVWDHSLNDDLKGPFLRDARAALDAAAPYMLEQAWDEGHEAGTEDEADAHLGRVSGTRNPYRAAAERGGE